MIDQKGTAKRFITALARSENAEGFSFMVTHLFCFSRAGTCDCFDGGKGQRSKEQR
jgi:hypothetical protein